jgi:hypothetical protein
MVTRCRGSAGDGDRVAEIRGETSREKEPALFACAAETSRSRGGCYLSPSGEEVASSSCHQLWKTNPNPARKSGRSSRSSHRQIYRNDPLPLPPPAHAPAARAGRLVASDKQAAPACAFAAKRPQQQKVTSRASPCLLPNWLVKGFKRDWLSWRQPTTALAMSRA